MDQQWNIGIDLWVISDGNYSDFYRGQIAEFALEFYPVAIESANSPAGRSCEPQGDQYIVQAEVAACFPDAWVIDLGILAYRDEPPPQAIRSGDRVRATLELGVDPYFYFEQLALRETMPPLVYTWKIDRITMRSAPLVQSIQPNIADCWVLDKKREQRYDVRSTNSPKPRGFEYIRDGNSLRPTHAISFLLHCTRLDVPAKRTSATATPPDESEGGT